jgi:hypothetical protein
MFSKLLGKGKNPIIASITNFFNSGVPYKKTKPTQKQFLKDSILHMTKGYCPLSSIENI